MELAVAKENNAAVKVLIINNGVLGPVYKHQMVQFGKSFCTSFQNIDFEYFAKSLGIQYANADKLTSEELNYLLLSDEVVLIDLVTT